MRAQCCICSDLFVSNETNVAATPCGHVFHEHCLARWFLTSKTCPSCRKGVAQNAVIPKLFFDIAEDERDGEVEPEQLTNELQNLRTRVAELNQKNIKDKDKRKELKKKRKQKEEEVENLSMVLQREQETSNAQKRMLKQYEAQLQVHKEERVEFLRAQRKLTELKHVETLVSGGVKECEDIIQQYGSNDKNSMQQLGKYTAILKREYEQAKVEKRALKEQFDKLRKSSYTASRELSELKTTCRHLQEQLTRSEDELKQAEKINTTLKAKISKLQYAKAHPAQASGSFLETPKGQDLSVGSLVDTPELTNHGRELFVTPKMTKPSESDMIDLEDNTNLNESFDLFEDSPQTSMRKTCMENNMKSMKISSAAAKVKAPKRVWKEAENVGNSFPLAALNIMKKREKTNQLLKKTVIRKDYDGLGGTASFTQPLSGPVFAAPRIISKAAKKVKVGGGSSNPALPNLRGFLDLT